MGKLMTPEEVRGLLQASFQQQIRAWVEVGRQRDEGGPGFLAHHKAQTFEEFCRDQYDQTRGNVTEKIKFSQFAWHGDAVRQGATSFKQIRPLFNPDIEDNAERENIWNKIEGDLGRPPRSESEVAAGVTRYLESKRIDWITLDQWDNQVDLLDPPLSKKQFNSQDNNSIEWAQWSWNPITGCKHDCPYCYARDIAERFYPGEVGFKPTVWPDRFRAPENTDVPAKAASKIAYKNVFTCSMADLFGRWVPAEWIEAVLTTVAKNPQWNFLFLTKFPKRMAEFEIPNNAWMGTTVDRQSRVKSAEQAFSKVKCGVKWLSVEPMLEPLKFSNLDMFDWIVIGGASASNNTPRFVPPIDWMLDLHRAGREAGCAIYYKDNAFADDKRLREFPWGKREEIPVFAGEKFVPLTLENGE